MPPAELAGGPGAPPASVPARPSGSRAGAVWSLRHHPLAGTMALLLLILLAWHLATRPGDPGGGAAVDPEYARLMGIDPAAGTVASAGAIPGPAAVAERAVELARHAFERGGGGGQGVGWHLLVSLGRVMLGYAIAVGIGVPLGFVIGLAPGLHRSLDPFIQILRPVSPLAWMPLALYALKDSAQAAIFIIAVSAVWPVLINTAAGAAGVRQEWLNVARVLDLPWTTRVWRIVLPAAVPMVLTGMRVSVGIAWFVIVAAEMVVGSSGIGYFIWNEWNNLQIASMIVAVLLIGGVGLLLDQALAWTGRHLAFRE